MTHPTTFMTHLRRIAANPDRTRDREILIAAADYIERAHNAAQPLGRQLATILDAALPLLQAEARREAAREADKSIRQITWKLRHESFSVAGLRQGLADPRGNLMLTFRPAPPAWFLPRPVCMRGGAARRFASDRHFHRGIQAEATSRKPSQ